MDPEISIPRRTTTAYNDKQRPPPPFRSSSSVSKRRGRWSSRCSTRKKAVVANARNFRNRNMEVPLSGRHVLKLKRCLRVARPYIPYVVRMLLFLSLAADVYHAFQHAADGFLAELDVVVGVVGAAFSLAFVAVSRDTESFRGVVAYFCYACLRRALHPRLLLRTAATVSVFWLAKKLGPCRLSCVSHRFSADPNQVKARDVLLLAARVIVAVSALDCLFASGASPSLRHAQALVTVPLCMLLGVGYGCREVTALVALYLVFACCQPWLFSESAIFGHHGSSVLPPIAASLLLGTMGPGTLSLEEVISRRQEDLVF